MSQNSSPRGLLNSLREHPEWTDLQGDEVFERLILGFDPEAIVAVLPERFDRLGEADGSVVLRLVEAFASPELLDALLESLEREPDLSADRWYEALSLLEGTGRLEASPGLLERWNDLVEMLDDETGSLEILAEQLEDDPDEAWVALQAFGAVEPEVRAEIIEGLARREQVGPGIVEILRLLAFAHDEETRTAALRGLEGLDGDGGPLRAAWVSLAEDHPDPEVVSRALARIGSVDSLPARVAPRLREGWVTAVDGEGRATVVLVAEERGRVVIGWFGCDVLNGVVEVWGRDEDGVPSETELRSSLGPSEVLNNPAAALAFLSGSLLLCGPGSPPSLRYWIERTAGAGFQARPLAADFGECDPSGQTAEAMSHSADEVLNACPTWIDRSELTRELAQAIELREGSSPADPRRDSGAYRFLFEHRLEGRLDRYRRMLLWMAAFWRAAGAKSLEFSAFVLGWQLSEPQYAVPGQPFLRALTTRSLETARRELREWPSAGG